MHITANIIQQTVTTTNLLCEIYCTDPVPIHREKSTVPTY